MEFRRWKMRIRIPASLVVMLLISGVPPYAAATTFFDGTFNDADWQVVDHQVGFGGTSSAIQRASGGNPDEFREVTTTLNPASGERRVFSFNFRSGAVYDPQSQGAIQSIDYSEDAIILNAPEAQSVGLGLRQDGELLC